MYRSAFLREMQYVLQIHEDRHTQRPADTHTYSRTNGHFCLYAISCACVSGRPPEMANS